MTRRRKRANDSNGVSRSDPDQAVCAYRVRGRAFVENVAVKVQPLPALETRHVPGLRQQ